jgi:hypothetical protein
MRASLPNAETIAVLLEPRMLIRCPPVELNAAVPYDGWSDVDALVRGTSMDAFAGVEAPAVPRNAVISLGTNLLHYPALDVDRHAFVDEDGVLHVEGDEGPTEWPQLGDCALVPSAHNQHAYCERSMTWGEYADVVEQMAAVGALGRGWAALSLRRGFTLLRHPLHPKPAAPKETDEKF